MHEFFFKFFTKKRILLFMLIVHRTIRHKNIIFENILATFRTIWRKTNGPYGIVSLLFKLKMHAMQFVLIILRSFRWFILSFDVYAIKINLSSWITNNRWTTKISANVRLTDFYRSIRTDWGGWSPGTAHL